MYIQIQFLPNTVHHDNHNDQPVKTVYCGNHTKHTNTLSRQYVKFLSVAANGMYSYH